MSDLTLPKTRPLSLSGDQLLFEDLVERPWGLNAIENPNLKGDSSLLNSIQERPSSLNVPPKISNDKNKRPEKVIRYAYENDALDLKQVNLIGVFGNSDNRQALILHPKGSTQKLKVGDKFNGGKVIQIGKDEVIYIRGNKNYKIGMR
ncbi:MAG: hypothetical protein OXC02_10555 [Rhodobacteraceae bacterium]|nr:hypothetical protein [Paracoccaceae bacterium]